MPTDTSEKGLESLIMRHMTGVDGLAIAQMCIRDSRRTERLAHRRRGLAALARMRFVDDDGEDPAALGGDLVEDEGKFLHRRDDDLLAVLNELAQEMCIRDRVRTSPASSAPPFPAASCSR